MIKKDVARCARFSQTGPKPVSLHVQNLWHDLCEEMEGQRILFLLENIQELPTHTLKGNFLPPFRVINCISASLIPLPPSVLTMLISLGKIVYPHLRAQAKRSHQRQGLRRHVILYASNLGDKMQLIELGFQPFRK